VDAYWATMLSATFLCYLVIPFAATLPPRLLHERSSPRTKLQTFNLFILGQASIQLNTFPSAHVASSIAASLVLIRIVPAVGIVFLFMSLSIAAGAVLGRYHYLPDVILGALLSVAISLVTLR
jgi:membrane-associated phospholipid phosphatase